MRKPRRTTMEDLVEHHRDLVDAEFALNTDAAAAS